MVNAAVSESTRELRTYLSFSLPVDPSQVVTLPDLDISYALGSTLVEWDKSKQIQASLASRWTVVNDKTYRFQIHRDAKWSNGTKLTCQDVKRSFERAKKVHGKTLKALFDRLQSIECVGEDSVVFHLMSPSPNGELFNKLTEPMYGIVKVNDRGDLDLSVSSGPFVLEGATEGELSLRRNLYWVHTHADMPERIVLRKSGASGDAQEVLLKDPWPNLMAAHSLMDQGLSERIRTSKFGLWKRNLDRLFFFAFLGKKSVGKDATALFRYLKQSLDHQQMTQNLTGYQVSEQIFPRGYPLFDPKFTCKSATALDLPEEFRKRPLRILLSPERVSKALQENISAGVEKALGKKPELVLVPISQVYERSKGSDIDFYAGSVGVADPHIEGALSYFFESDPVIIPSGSGHHDFAKRFAALRGQSTDESSKLQALRAVISETVCEGYTLPLFHFSTTVIARPELDLSQVAETDESVSFSKVRFRK